MNQLYKDYCRIELTKNPREVKEKWYSNRSAEITDTMYSEAFCNQQRAEYWLRDNSSHKTPDPRDVCRSIAAVGNLMVMKWARQQGFPWTNVTCLYAAKSGQLEMLQWLRENGCPWDEPSLHADLLLQIDIWKS
ncbi:expressed unknown protein [Seminavis robusta]|uniref:Uncharacterized protein n=1 Tax=Seminavis robusta TaxID=568900 RepID=A0A9N8EZV8_9STRA|nr:expressed unknown protein [Seminavis robusta]|eukprot:Sro2751_g105871.1  (134) ;mRNA; r:7968-8369